MNEIFVWLGLNYFAMSTNVGVSTDCVQNESIYVMKMFGDRIESG